MLSSTWLLKLASEISVEMELRAEDVQTLYVGDLQLPLIELYGDVDPATTVTLGGREYAYKQSVPI